MSCRRQLVNHDFLINLQVSNKSQRRSMHAMAQGVAAEASVSSSSAAAAAGNWWESRVNNSFSSSSWSASTSISRRWAPPSTRHADLSSSPPSYDDADLSVSNATSFTHASGHEALSMDSSSADLSGEPVMENHLWSQVLLNNIGTASEVQNGHEDGENSLNQVGLRREVFNPACDYLKKMDSHWDLINPSSFNCLEKHLNSYAASISNGEGETSTHLSDLVSNWSIAPPNNSTSPSNSMAHYLANINSHVKHEIPISSQSPFSSNLMVGDQSSASSYPPSYQESPFFLRQQNPNSSMRYQIGDLKDNSFCSGMMEAIDPSSNRRSTFSDGITFGRCLSKKAPMELRGLKGSVKSSELCDGNKEEYESSRILRNGRVSGTAEGKKKRSEDTSESHKKSKFDSLMVSSSQKMQVPKVKIAEKISALQQLVSPFGKTDQASVLMETITCIRILQEQVQLLSDPYLKSTSNKEHNSWGEIERKGKAEANYDLRSKGLCLVPVSSIPQVHRESIRPDYWMPTYRSCLYR
ncbi:hypothetical protein Cni_G25640 [Canna indica]|uniref:BHLH domain-containing protein n=1 Tax=Canna indica TaxID=4628 RepID=A0AAQ3L0D2_9LILI|nr:hypothetical protein Cni_G25640 [Canna indica]